MLKHLLFSCALLGSVTTAMAQLPSMSCGGTIPLNPPQTPIGSGGDGSGPSQRPVNPRQGNTTIERPIIGDAPQPATAPATAGTANRTEALPAPYSIPVVFHWIVPPGKTWDANYVTVVKDLVAAQIAALNRDFGRTNSDAGIDPVTGQPYKKTSTSAPTPAADTQIQFVPAKVRPDGSCNNITITGLPAIPPHINFVVGTSLTSSTALTSVAVGSSTGKQFKLTAVESVNNIGNADFDPVGMKIKETDLGGADAWDIAHYLNIWVADVQYPTATGSNPPYRVGSGYATFPTFVVPDATPATDNAWRDGVVINYRVVSGPGTGGVNPDVLTVANPPNAPTPYWNNGRIASHEVGHYFNLWHVWGDESCGIDLVTDTPRQQNANGFGSASPDYCNISGNTSSCTGVTTKDMSMNYMDYTNDACKNMFTTGQRDRMLETLLPGAFRATLLESRALGFGFSDPQPVAVGAWATSGGSLTCTFKPLASCLGTTSNYTVDVKKVVPDATNFTAAQAFTGTVSSVTTLANGDKQFVVSFPQATANYMVDIEINANVTGVPTIHRRVRVYRFAPANGDIPGVTVSSCTPSFVYIQSTRTAEKITARFYNTTQSRTYTFNSLGGTVALSAGFPAQQIGFTPTHVRLSVTNAYTGLQMVVSKTYLIESICETLCEACRPAPPTRGNGYTPMVSERLTISPNPASGGVRFSFEDDGLRDGVITITTLTGKLVRSFTVSRTQDSFDTSTLPQGAYLVEFAGGETIAHQTLIVQH